MATETDRTTRKQCNFQAPLTKAKLASEIASDMSENSLSSLQQCTASHTARHLHTHTHRNMPACPAAMTAPIPRLSQRCLSKCLPPGLSPGVPPGGLSKVPLQVFPSRCHSGCLFSPGVPSRKVSLPPGVPPFYENENNRNFTEAAYIAV